MKNIIALIVFISLALSVYDCGYKGPLYLPNKANASNSTTNKSAASMPVASKPTASPAWTITSANESKTIESSSNKN